MGLGPGAAPGVKKGRDELGVEDALPFCTEPRAKASLNPHQSRTQRHTIRSGIEKLFKLSSDLLFTLLFRLR